jgi:hypothetical protein
MPVIPWLIPQRVAARLGMLWSCVTIQKVMPDIRSVWKHSLTLHSYGTKRNCIRILEQSLLTHHICCFYGCEDAWLKRENILICIPKLCHVFYMQGSEMCRHWLLSDVKGRSPNIVRSPNVVHRGFHAVWWCTLSVLNESCSSPNVGCIVNQCSYSYC